MKRPSFLRSTVIIIAIILIVHPVVTFGVLSILVVLLLPLLIIFASLVAVWTLATVRIASGQSDSQGNGRKEAIYWQALVKELAGVVKRWVVRK